MSRNWERDELATELAKTVMAVNESYGHMSLNERASGAVQMLDDLDYLSVRDGNISAAWARTLLESAVEMIHALAEKVADQETELREASSHVEGVIALRTKFDGDPPYVGWPGLGLALKEALDERDRLKYGDADYEEASAEKHPELPPGSQTLGETHGRKVDESSPADG